MNCFGYPWVRTTKRSVVNPDGVVEHAHSGLRSQIQCRFKSSLVCLPEVAMRPVTPSASARHCTGWLIYVALKGFDARQPTWLRGPRDPTTAIDPCPLSLGASDPISTSTARGFVSLNRIKLPLRDGRVSRRPTRRSHRTAGALRLPAGMTPTADRGSARLFAGRTLRPIHRWARQARQW